MVGQLGSDDISATYYTILDSWLTFLYLNYVVPKRTSH